jgi:hypothetical protein
MSPYRGLILIQSTELVQELTRKYLKLDYDTVGFVIQTDESFQFQFKSIFSYETVLTKCASWHDVITDPYVNILLYYPSDDTDLVTMINNLQPSSIVDSILRLTSPLPLYFNIAPYIQQIPTCVYNKEAKPTTNATHLANVMKALVNLLQTDTFRRSLFLSSSQDHQPYIEWIQNLTGAYLANDIPVININDLIDMTNHFTNSSISNVTHRDYKYAILSSDLIADVEQIGDQMIDLINPKTHLMSVNNLIKLRNVLGSPPFCNNHKYNYLRQSIDQTLIMKHS